MKVAVKLTTNEESYDGERQLHENVLGDCMFLFY